MATLVPCDRGRSSSRSISGVIALDTCSNLFANTPDRPTMLCISTSETPRTVRFGVFFVVVGSCVWDRGLGLLTVELTSGLGYRQKCVYSPGVSGCAGPSFAGPESFLGGCGAVGRVPL